MSLDSPFMHQASAFFRPTYNTDPPSVWHNEARREMVKGIIVTVAAVALAILGIALCAFGQPMGILPLLLSLPLFYYGCNTITLASNLARICNNPLEVLKIQQGRKEREIAEIFANELTKNTFCFDWSAKLLLRRIQSKLNM